MVQILFLVLIGIFVFTFAFERFLDFLNTRLWSNTLPDELKEVYDEDQYKRSQDYEKKNVYHSQIKAAFSFVIILSMLLAGGFGIIDSWVRGITSHPVVMALIFFGVISLLFSLIFLPFSLYETFVIEQKFGFNRQSLKSFFSDVAKELLLSGLIGGILISIFVWFFTIAGQWFWLYAWMVFTAFSLFMMMFYSTLIVPLFNKQTPLEQGEMREAIELFAKKTGFNISNIYVIDGSKRSTKANAYFSGLGKQKRVVLYDTLLKDYSSGELVAILAHEIGHYKKKHIQKGLFVSVISMGFMFVVIGQIIGNPALSKVLGSDYASVHMGLIAFGILFSPVSLIMGIMNNYFSRMHEYEADAFAAQNHNPALAISALRKLYSGHLANLRPHPWYEFVHFSHPGLMKRLNHLKKFMTHDTRNHSAG